MTGYDSLTLEQQVGQLLMVGFPGTEMGEEIRCLLDECTVGGVCLFLHNCSGGPQQVRALTTALQDHAGRRGLPPLLIATDQEGGVVTRLRHPFAVFPSQMAQAATGDPHTAYRVAQAMAREMRSVGINWNFAPVLDINNNASNPVIGVRSFGDGSAHVAEFGVAAVRGYHDGGVLACGKHFPGHGDTHVDSHLDLPTVSFDWARLRDVELAPFRAAIAGGLESIMTAHIRFPAIDDLPATLSAKMLRGVLRRRLGFRGLIVTDALNMKAIADTYGPARAAVMAIQAGADVCLGLHSVEDTIAAFHALVAAVKDGTIPARRFAEAVRHVSELKSRLPSGGASRPPIAAQDWPVPEHQALARAVAAASVRVARNQGVLPLRPDAAGPVGLVDLTLVRFSMVEEARKPATYLRDLLARRLPGLRGLIVDSQPAPQEAAAALALAAASGTLILVTRNAAQIPEQADLVRSLLTLGKPTVLYAARNPYDMAAFPDAAAALTTYGDPPCSLDAAAAVLLGDRAAP